MRDLEEAFRAGLTGLADEADSSPAAVHEVVARARRGAARRRRSAVVAVAGVAAGVAVIAGLTAVVQGRHGGDEATPPATTPAVVAPSMPGGYRLEFWHDVAIYVPATWGWGSAPTQTAAGSALLCGVGVVQQDGRSTNADLPYVGRPVALSDTCTSGWVDGQPKAPYVWLGGDVPVGTVDLGGGWKRETIEVGGVTVSVASDDADLRRAILGSAHQVTGECQPRLDNAPSPGGSTDRAFVPISMTVCAYAADSTRLDYDLLYEQELSMGPAKDLVAAVDRAPSMGPASCFAASGGEWALLRLRGTGGQFRDYVVDMQCPSIVDPTGNQHVLNGETVRPWAVGGMNAVLHSSPLIDAPDRFIPPLP